VVARRCLGGSASTICLVSATCGSGASARHDVRDWTHTAHGWASPGPCRFLGCGRLGPCGRFGLAHPWEPRGTDGLLERDPALPTGSAQERAAGAQRQPHEPIGWEEVGGVSKRVQVVEHKWQMGPALQQQYRQPTLACREGRQNLMATPWRPQPSGRVTSSRDGLQDRTLGPPTCREALKPELGRTCPLLFMSSCYRITSIGAGYGCIAARKERSYCM
jgi:hypothetical protein